MPDGRGLDEARHRGRIRGRKRRAANRSIGTSDRFAAAWERRRCYLPAAASVVELPEAAPAAVDVAVDCCWVAVVESVRA